MRKTPPYPVATDFEPTDDKTCYDQACMSVATMLVSGFSYERNTGYHVFLCPWHAQQDFDRLISHKVMITPLT